MPGIEALAKRFKKAKAERGKFNQLLDECVEFTQPLRDRVYPSGTVRETDRWFDGVAVAAVEALAASVLKDVWPTDSRPFEIVPGTDVPPDAVEEFGKALEALSFSIIQAVNDSNFRPAALDALRDWTVSDGVLLVDGGTPADPLQFTSLPIAEAVLDIGPGGAYDALFRQRKMPLHHLRVLWPEAHFTTEWLNRMRGDQDEEVTVIEASWRDWSQRVETWRYTVWIEKENLPLVERSASGRGSCPFIAFSYSRRANERVGRGPVQLALADIRSLNKSAEMMLQHGDLALGGIWTYDDDGVLNPDAITLVPGTLIPKAPGSNGLQNITPAGDFRFAEFLITRLTEQVRTALFWNDLGNLQKTPRSATELLQRTADRAERMSGAASRLLTEFLRPLVYRVLWLMERMNGSERGIRLDGSEARLRALGPVTRAQAQTDIMTFNQFLEIANARFGPQATLVSVNVETAFPWLAERFGLPARLLRSKAEKVQMMQAVQQAAEVAQPAEQAGG